MPHSVHVMALQLYRQGRFRNGGFNMPYTAGPLVRRAVTTIARRLASGAVKRRRMDVSRYSTAESGSSSAPLTGHFDYKTDYRKRRLTRGRRRVIRRRRKWTRRILKTVREGTIGSSHIIRRSFAPDISTPAGESRSVSWTLYGVNGTNTPNLNTTNDVGQSMYEISNTDWSNWSFTSLSSVDHKIHAYHGTMETTIVNTGGYDALVEVYFIRARGRQAEGWGSPNNVYQTGFLKQSSTIDPDTGNQVGTPLTPNELGVTPFQNALFCRMFNIYKRQKFRIPANGGEISFTTHDRRPRTYSLSTVRPNAWDRGTSGILVQWQGVALGSVGAEVPTPAAPTTLAFQVVRRYRFKFAENESATDGRN